MLPSSAYWMHNHTEQFTDCSSSWGLWLAYSKPTVKLTNLHVVMHVVEYSSCVVQNLLLHQEAMKSKASKYLGSHSNNDHIGVVTAYNFAQTGCSSKVKSISSCCSRNRINPHLE